ncbi:hypothetical protein SAMN04487989_1011213 [Bizionia echini]|uniref:TonB-dependent receptor plug domain-containing protein n=1 Tax=Bizionia echini TaxID=649333 RepID=A0A1I4ZZH1_9FLAO|nr:hypothetical protein [Bizionia echini]SFN55621.1 hypothetical protein SAMN04487989_1011213 [Bizionia echini]
MIKKIFTLYLFVLCSAYGIAQNPEFNFVENKYLDYFKMQPEVIYTQTNKSKYLRLEELWFKSYIYNPQTQKPYLTTSNIYASIYDSDGILIEKKMYYAENGITHGNFNLKENYAPGIYFLKVSTNWMKNFNDPHHSLQQFEIIGTESESEKTADSEQKYDFQLLPEGGHILQNSKNSIGFKGTDINGNPLIVTLGKVINEKGDIISTFKSNEFGIGKFSIFIAENDTYHVEATLENGTVIKKPLPDAEIIGLTISVNTLNQNTLFVSIKTNNKTLPYLLNKPHYLLIHRDGLLKKINLEFKPNTLDYTIAIPKTDLYDGVNILTIFNDKNQALLERIIFNRTENLIHEVSFLGKKTSYDSTQIRLVSDKKNNLKKYMSVSVLPAGSESYDTNNTITSSFLLQPYVKGKIDNPHSYFKDNNRKTNYNLDLLLLTQGWSRYEWNNIFFSPQIAKYNFESGFQIQGKINEPNAEDYKEIVLFSANNELMLSTEVKDSYFTFDHLSLMDSSVVSISAKNKRGKLTTPKVYYNVYPTFIKDSLNTENLINKAVNIISNTDSFIYDDSITELDTVMLKIKKESRQEKFMINGGVNNRSVDLKTVYSFSTRILDVIRSNGFDVIESGVSINILSRRSSNLQGRLNPNVYLDGILVSDQLELIQYLTVADVEKLFVAKTGYGMDGAGGTINIFSKDGSRSKSNPKGKFSSNTIKIGYSMPKSYYAPMYNTAKRIAFSKFGVLNWIPNITPNKNGEYIFNIPNYFYEDVLLYIEGMCEDGSLISKVETLRLQ